jgi:hypothetical protein
MSAFLSSSTGLPAKVARTSRTVTRRTACGRRASGSALQRAQQQVRLADLDRDLIQVQSRARLISRWIADDRLLERVGAVAAQPRQLGPHAHALPVLELLEL